MAAFLAQISSLIFGNGGRLEEKNCGSKLNFFFKIEVLRRGVYLVRTNQSQVRPS